ncbi:hypothetical protein AgCh_031821 [Apium graveolens]
MALEWLVLGYAAGAEAVMVLLLTIPGLSGLRKGLVWFCNDPGPSSKFYFLHLFHRQYSYCQLVVGIGIAVCGESERMRNTNPPLPPELICNIAGDDDDLSAAKLGTAPT